ncbi:hypothetical protein NADFUDRAFT_40726 [Nadsonia fulvescens var. elongata DSM 6958]|uniref:Uncharacterized protein n=1 Tax=Nadsonia fulvescens var. elongata DSM 6958 TaxID=857566 RepID=A0A1E3PRX2_9ASCO|nr:hypothetical protein NADFUDRAFT_40726 [Nadsonia fulvescens var. elongata DSM 6958]
MSQDQAIMDNKNSIIMKGLDLDSIIDTRAKRVRKPAPVYEYDAPTPRKKSKKKVKKEVSIKPPKLIAVKESKPKAKNGAKLNEHNADSENSKPKIKVLKLVVKKPVCPPPKFTIIQSEYPEYILWPRLQIREFFTKFESLCDLNQRQNSTINDVTQEWNDWIYKSIIVSLMKIIYESPDLEVDKSIRGNYLKDMERIPADSFRLWGLLHEYLFAIDASQLLTPDDISNDPALYGPSDTEENYLDRQNIVTEEKLSKKKKRKMILHDFDKEAENLHLVSQLVSLAACTETVRNLVQVNMDEFKEQYDKAVITIDKLADSHNISSERLENIVNNSVTNLKPEEREIVIDTVKDEYFKIQKALVDSWRKLNVRSMPLGKDNLGNSYWILQTKGENYVEWGSWIICDKNPKLLHPSGSEDPLVLLQNELVPKTILGRNMNTSLYCIDTKQGINDLVKWIRENDNSGKRRRRWKIAPELTGANTGEDLARGLEIIGRSM